VRTLGPMASDAPATLGREAVKKMLAMLCLGLSACDSSLPGDRPLQRGMTEQEVAELKGKQVPDRIIMRTCGTATPKPFPCKVQVYERGLWAGRYHPELSVVFEEARGQWVVSQWL
jgi:hypothetical protein